MVTRDDLQLSRLPAESCANCGFLLQFKAHHDGSDGQAHQPVTLFERARGLDYLDEAIWFGDRRKLATIECWMRRDFPGAEARPGLSGDEEAKRLTLAAMHRDRSANSDAHCPQFTPWVPHLTLEQHWEERKTYLLERDRRRWEAAQEKARKDSQADLETTRKASERYWNRRFLGVGVVGLIIAIAQVVAAFNGGITINIR